MDLSALEMLIPDIAGWLNIQPSTLLLYLIILSTGANVISRIIPDDVTGFWGQVRRVCTIIGAYTPNRVTRGITVNDVARSIVTTAADEVIDAAVESDTLIPEVGAREGNHGNHGKGNFLPFSGEVVPAFDDADPRVRDAKTGKFASRKKEG